MAKVARRVFTGLLHQFEQGGLLQAKKSRRQEVNLKTGKRWTNPV